MERMRAEAHSRAAPEMVGAFRHEALVYAGEEQFVEGISAFIREGVAAGEPTLVVVGTRKLELLREALGVDASEAVFADMSAVGHNPARIIPAWEEFVRRRAGDGVRLRGVGEPIFPERGADELVECQRHESLLNLAFAHAPAFWLVCPYDATALDPAVIAEAYRSHPYITRNGRDNTSVGYIGLEAIARPFAVPLPEPVGEVHQLHFENGPLDALRHFVAARAAAAGLGQARVVDLVLAVNEVASNSIAHGGGRGLLRVWQADDRIVCEVRDRGRFETRLRPASTE